MREIKFRAWTGKKMMCQDKQYLASFIRRVVLQIILDHGGENYREHESYLPNGGVINEYLMQSTGLKDAQEQDIYEGDIIKGGDMKPLPVIFEDGAFRLAKIGWCVDKALIREKLMKVIGNIYETPELLKGDV